MPLLPPKKTDDRIPYVLHFMLFLGLFFLLIIGSLVFSHLVAAA